MPFEIRGVADPMLPESPLPNPFLAPFDLPQTAMRGRGEMAGKPPLPHADPIAVIGIVGRQGPDRMEHIRQDGDGIDPEGFARQSLTHRLAQGRDMPQQRIIIAPREAQGKEIAVRAMG